MRIWILTLMIIIAASCAKEYTYEVDSELQLYFEIFEAEGALRGLEIDLDAEGIGGTIEFIKDQTTVGQCLNGDQGGRRIFIDKAFWSAYDHYEREFIVFHELGHCYLRLEHNDDRDSHQNCVSIMQSGVGGCKNNYKESTRDEYLDELFNN